MNRKTLHTVWSVSLLILIICTMALAGFRIADVPVSDGLQRGIGIVQPVTLPIFVFVTVKKVKKP